MLLFYFQISKYKIHHKWQQGYWLMVSMAGCSSWVLRSIPGTSCEICGGQRSTGADILPSTSVSPVRYYSTIAPYTCFFI